MIAHFGDSLSPAEFFVFLCTAVGAAVLFCLFFLALLLGGLMLWEKASYRRSRSYTNPTRFPKGRNR